MFSICATTQIIIYFILHFQISDHYLASSTTHNVNISPFDQRCLGLHDPRISSTNLSWLPHAETLINSIGSSANIDKLYHQQLTAVYCCSPIYGYIPPKRWKSDDIETQAAWNHLYTYICNSNTPLPLSSNDFGYHAHTVMAGTANNIRSVHQNRKPELSALHEVAIVLQLRELRLAQCYAYMPTHLFCGELCMLLQTRTFYINEGTDNFFGIGTVKQVNSDIDTKHKSSQSDGEQSITAHEIAFGPVGDPSVRQAAVWFNIPSSDLVECTPQQAKRHKRSRHRLKKKPISAASSAILFRSRIDFHNDDHIEFKANPSFLSHQPIDNAAFDLITSIFRHRLCVLTFVSHGCLLDDSRQRFHSLVTEEHRLRECFESQRRFWMTWAWPVNLGMDEVDDGTDVPTVNGMYHFMVDESDNFRTESFQGNDNGLGDNVVSVLSKFSLGFVWKSFVANIQLKSGVIATWVSE